MVDTARAFPPVGFRRDQLPMWVKAGGLYLDPWMPGRQTAWLRRSDGGWLAVVTVEASSGNSLSHLTMQLWLLPEDITTDPPPANGGQPS
nr:MULTISPECIES: hypothetical protein [unclassified Mycolicibacterium]